MPDHYKPEGWWADYLINPRLAELLKASPDRWVAWNRQWMARWSPDQPDMVQFHTLRDD